MLWKVLISIWWRCKLDIFGYVVNCFFIFLVDLVVKVISIMDFGLICFFCIIYVVWVVNICVFLLFVLVRIRSGFFECVIVFYWFEFNLILFFLNLFK